MSTNDVPGAKKSNHDVLAMGCWAEHDDGSLILVESVEGGRVVYSIFDVDSDPPVEYRDAMPEAGFKTQFSWPTDTGDRWTWHDKTPFPWNQIMRSIRPGARYATADDQLTAAQRVAQSLRLRARRIREDRVPPGPEEARRGMAIIDKIQRAMKELRQ